MPQRTYREQFTLIASIASFTATIIIPIGKFLITPTPFNATVYYESLRLPAAVAKSWSFPVTSPRKNTKLSHATFEPPQEVVVVTVSNAGHSVRHNVNMTIAGITSFAGIELSPLNQSIANAAKWTSPDYQEQNSKLFLPSIDFPAQTTFQVYVWGKYTFFGPQIVVGSDEGVAEQSHLGTVGGWPLMLALNAWWIMMTICAGSGIWLLRRFNQKRTP